MWMVLHPPLHRRISGFVASQDDESKTYDSRFDFEIIDMSDQPALLSGLTEAAGTAPAIGLDMKRLLLDRARKLIFDPQAIQVEQKAAVHLDQAGIAAPPPPRANMSLFPDVFPRFGDPFGIRLKSFAPSWTQARKMLACSDHRWTVWVLDL
jgi:hypothetical protein